MVDSVFTDRCSEMQDHAGLPEGWQSSCIAVYALTAVRGGDLELHMY